MGEATSDKQFTGRMHHSPANPTALWDLLEPCNFSCSYCYSERLTVRPRRSASAVESQLAAFAERLPQWNVNLSGGEPMIHPHFLEIASGLAAQGNRIGLYTNLSRSATAAAFARTVPPTGVEFINAAVHAHHRPADADLSQFARDARMLLDAGFPVHASYIIHPQNVHRVRDDLERLRRWGVQTRVQVFRGIFDGATYPAAFDSVELDLASEWEADLHRGRAVRNDFTGQGGSCRAGAVYMEIDPNGDCWRCGAYRSMRREPLGNLFDGSLQVNGGPERCRLWACLSCRQGHAFHLDGLADLFTQPTTAT